MEKKLVGVSEQEVIIDFTLHTKCRTNLHLKSLITTSPIAFKIQTSSPHKFLVNPPTGLLSPSSSTTIHIILKPQPHLPSSFPRSSSDRFLIKTIQLTNSSSESSTHHNLFKGTATTFDVKLNVVYVGVLLLHNAVCNGDLDAVKNILKRQKEIVDCKGEKGTTALHLAASGGDVKCVKVLIEAGADKNGKEDSEGRTALFMAAEKGDSQMVMLLLEMGADSTVLTDEIGGGSCASSALDVARDNGHEGVVKILEWESSVLTLARRGELNNLQLLLKKGASPNQTDQYGLTPLHAAAIKGHKDIVSMLIDFGMDIECKDKEGHTALHLAIEGGNLDTVQVLVSKGANVNAMSKRGCTALFIARTMCYDDILRFLTDRGASCTTRLSSSSSSLSSML